MPLHGQDVLVVVLDRLDDAVRGKGHGSKIRGKPRDGLVVLGPDVGKRSAGEPPES